MLLNTISMVPASDSTLCFLVDNQAVDPVDYKGQRHIEFRTTK